MKNDCTFINPLLGNFTLPQNFYDADSWFPPDFPPLLVLWLHFFLNPWVTFIVNQFESSPGASVSLQLSAVRLLRRSQSWYSFKGRIHHRHCWLVNRYASQPETFKPTLPCSWSLGQNAIKLHHILRIFWPSVFFKISYTICIWWIEPRSKRFFVFCGTLFDRHIKSNHIYETTAHPDADGIYIKLPDLFEPSKDSSVHKTSASPSGPPPFGVNFLFMMLSEHLRGKKEMDFWKLPIV